jgi:hypothetical protein
MIGNLGKKDEDGRQVRIEHRGRNLRASRTGGVALRQEVRAGRIGLTANTSKGLRLSSALGPGTQVAIQGGRFVLRGVYGSGPVRFNLSKSGLSASLASDVGRLNLTNPARSSAKLFGVQVRGQKAAWMNVGAMLAAAVVMVLKLVVLAVIVLVRGLVWLGGAVAVGVRRLVARWRLWQKERAFEALMDTVSARATPIGPGDVRIVPDGDAAQMGRLAELLEMNGRAAGSSGDAGGSGSASPGDGVLDELAEAWRVAGALFAGQADAEIVETVLALDEGCVAAGGRTVAQEEMLGVIAEAGGVRVVVAGEASLS